MKTGKLIVVNIALGTLTCTLANTSMAVEASAAIEQNKNQLAKSVQTEMSTSLAPTTSGLSGFGSVIENFLPDFQFASFLAGQNESDPITMDFGYFLFANKQSDDGENKSKLQVKINRGAELSKDVTAFFGDGFAAANASQISDTDDVEVTFAYNFVNDRFGRSFKQHAGLFTALHTQAINKEDYSNLLFQEADARLKLNTMVVDVKDNTLEAKLQSLTQPVLNCNGVSQLLITELTNSIQLDAKLASDPRDQDVKSAIEEHSKLLDDISAIQKQCQAVEELKAKRQPSIKRAEAEINSKRFSHLLGNQPQLYISGSYRHRDDLIGAKELSVKLTYERSIAKSLNTFLKNGAGAFVENYTKSNESFKEDAKKDGRFKLALEYSDVDDQRVDFGGMQFLKKGGEKLTGTIGYGRSLMFQGDDPVLRMDAEVDFIEHLSDTEGNDRTVATLTFTRKISDKLSIPFSLQWANKGEFLDEDRRQVSANVGIKFDFNRSNN